MIPTHEERVKAITEAFCAYVESPDSQSNPNSDDWWKQAVDQVIAADPLTKWAESQEWVRVEDRLPSKRGDYLCWQPDIMHDDEIQLVARPVVIHFTGVKFRSSYAITHWKQASPPKDVR